MTKKKLPPRGSADKLLPRIYEQIEKAERRLSFLESFSHIRTTAGESAFDVNEIAELMAYLRKLYELRDSYSEPRRTRKTGPVWHEDAARLVAERPDITGAELVEALSRLPGYSRTRDGIGCPDDRTVTEKTVTNRLASLRNPT